MTAPLDKNKLTRRMKITRANRFACAKRLEAKARNTRIISSLIQLVSIVAGVLAIAYSGAAPERALDLFGVAVTGVTVTGLFLTLGEPISTLLSRAESMHRCAREVSHIFRLLESDQIDLAKASRWYEDVMSRYEMNHDPCDNRYSLYERRWELSDEAKGLNYLNSVVPYYASAFSPVGFVVLALTVLVGCWFGFTYLVETSSSWMVPSVSTETISGSGT